MNRLCPYCFYQNEPGQQSTCAQCQRDLTDIPCCQNCGATQLEFARYCYHCGLRLLPASLIAKNSFTYLKNPYPGLKAVNLGPESEFVEQLDPHATQFQQESLRLLHVQSGTLLALPAQINPILIGKAGAGRYPHIDVLDFPNSEVVSRQQACLHMVRDQCAIADLDSTNGTYVNEVPLPTGHQHPLQFGDRINFGPSDKFTLLFIRELPINLKHLQTVSGGDGEFEHEILETYGQRAQQSLEQMKAAYAEQDQERLVSTAEDLTLASHNVGAQVVHLLASQFQTAPQGNAAHFHRQLLKVIEEALQKVRFFTKVYY
ncbi:FHA domain-containing protein [Acaryochloris marina]|uniref:FHA domain protein n=1 Tax=Acaryochloris marina (strain MBIC 11017) TaxID=329726 RepID=B0C8J9_ACAM1|nr:FHA domain-containing protein [Acaryochloris marina]ABW30154.1 FHA domain protein [Acaryochloris marina MBIC11017]